MNLLRSEFSTVTNSGTEPQHLVRLVGEGGNSIEVKMPSTPGETALSEGEIIARAAAVMMEVATLLMHPEEARHHGSAKQDAPSPIRKFRFVYRDAEGMHQVPDAEFSSVEGARDDALRSAADLLAQARDEGTEPEGWAVRVYDTDNRMLFQVDFREVKQPERRFLS